MSASAFTKAACDVVYVGIPIFGRTLSVVQPSLCAAEVC